METVLGNEDLFQEIAGMFIESCPDYIAKIKEGIAGNEKIKILIAEDEQIQNVA